MVEGPNVTIGVRDLGLDIPGRTATYTDESGACVLWGEVYLPEQATKPAQWVLDQYRERGEEVLDVLNGSYLAVVDDGTDAFVATDIVRTWECYYADNDSGRIFGTDPVAVGSTLRDPEIAGNPLLEFVHLGVILGDRTVLKGLRRAPFDGYVAADGIGTFRRFVYEPKEFDYVSELAERLQRAMTRRASLPGRKGVLLSGGYDSRMLLAGIPEIDESYTLGYPNSSEVAVAKKVAEQYNTTHKTLIVDEGYLNIAPEVIQHGHGIKESLHIHHAGYEDQMTVDTMYHGLLCDTYLRGHFLPRDGVELFGHRFPRNRLDPDPDPAEVLWTKLGFMPASDRIFPRCERVSTNSSVEYVRGALESQLVGWEDRYDSIYNGIAMFGIQNQPSVPFRMHLADNYLESFVAADRELIDWHLSTPPEYRNTQTFLRALKQIDPQILRHRPPDRPHNSYQLNQVEKFLRRKIPLVPSFDVPWPDREEIYKRNNLDMELFATYPEVHDLPARIKLRINDITNWLEMVMENRRVTPADALCPPNTA
ncbi:asparagine synthase-related protein (plasmid) [Haloferacaceae archaeon DSL9]